MYEQILAGIVTGIGYAITGWQKNKENDFDWMKLGKSVVVCVVVGGAAGYFGTDFSVFLTGTIGVGVTKMVDLVISFVKK